MNDLINTAMMYKELGLSVIATDALKQSVVKWKEFQSHPTSADQLIRMFKHHTAHGLAVVTGAVSGNLEVIDIDSKYDLNTFLFERLLADIGNSDPGLIRKLVIAQSRSGGIHLYYRCEEVEPNQPLARRPTTEEERRIHPKEKLKVLIETRGSGGYVLAPPSPGYRFLQHDYRRIPVISRAERNVILTSARSFNQYVERKIEWRPPKIRPTEELSPLDDYNLRGEVIKLLQKHGWIVVGQTSKRTYFRRPGETDKRNSGSFNHDLNCFSVFTTSTRFKPRTKYLPYAVYAELECNGVFTEAARRLAKEGYGQQSIYQRQKAAGYRR